MRIDVIHIDIPILSTAVDVTQEPSSVVNMEADLCLNLLATDFSFKF